MNECPEHASDVALYRTDEERFCERCDARTEHILYRVPKKIVLLYLKEHPENLHATCVVCAKSTVLTGEERERVLASLRG